jgi:RNA polymerase sigma-70 factor (ECF subfamily)
MGPPRSPEPGYDSHIVEEIGPPVEAARAGDAKALDRLLRSQYDRVFAVCRRLTGNDADAADATQESLIAIVRGLPRFDGRSRLSTWVYRIAVNASLDELRRRGRRPELGLDASLDFATDNASAGSSEGVADRLDIDAALLRLPVEYRAAVVLRDLCGLDYAEIAEALDLPAGTVRSRISRGRAALVPLLAGNQPDTTVRPTAPT